MFCKLGIVVIWWLIPWMQKLGKKLSETQLSMSEGELGKMKEQLKLAKITARS